MPTIYIQILGEGRVEDLHIPIARLVTMNKTTGEATFELDTSVESFTPVEE